MTPERETTLQILGLISTLPGPQREAVLDLVEHLREHLKTAGEPVGTLALALLGAEMQEKIASEE